MLIINTASHHLLKLFVVVNCSRGLTGNFMVQHLFVAYHLLRDDG